MFTRFLLLLVLALPVAAQDALQSPEAFLGYALGERFTPHHRVMAYYEHVAQVRPNVELQTYGETYEGRPLVFAKVSSQANMDRLEEIRTDNLKRAALLDGDPAGAPVALVWLSYNVHGNESVSTEAAMQTLYDLANPDNSRTQAWLDNTVVFLDPCINPDGRDRYVHFYQQTRGAEANPDPAAKEHVEHWPGGRTNHYYFDLNRDWAWQTQRESRARIPVYSQWMPHVHVDFHEQSVDAPYYFAPAAEPYHEVITDWQREFQTTIGQNHARYFDEQGWLYFTREVFDLLYPSYGDTWPTFNGAIGMTYEQGGSGRAGLAVETSSGDTLTLADRIAHHYTTGLSTVEASSQNAERLTEEFSQYFTSAAENPPGPYRTYVVKRTSGVDKLAELVDLLARQGIRFGPAAERREVRGFSYDSGEEAEVTVEPGDLVVSAYQPKAAFVKVLFEPESALSDSLTYDITAWSLPYVYGLDAYALTTRLDPAEDALDLTPPEAVFADETPYAYLAEWKSFSDLKLLVALLNTDVRVRFATERFTMDDDAYEAGTLIVLRADNERLGADFDARVRAAVEETGQPVRAVNTGFVTTGSDFGSSAVRFLEKPNVALLSGENTSSYAVGETWHFFEQQIGYPVTRLGTDYIGRVDLWKYDVLILPPGNYGSVLSGNTIDMVKRWIRDGGRLIALESAASFLAGKDDFGLKTLEAEPDTSDADATPRYADRQRDNLRESVTGSIFALDLDNSHPLGFGYEETYFTLKRGDRVFEPLEDGWNVGTLNADSYRSGFTGSKARKKLESGMVLGVHSLGQGSVVYMADNPLFRGFWQNGKLLFGNAVFLVGQ